MLHKLNTLIHLSIRQKLIFLHSVILISLIRVLLTFLPFKKVRGYLQRFSTNKEFQLFAPNYTPNEIAWGMKLASRYLLRKKPCFVQALALWSLFQRRNYPAELRIGVRKKRNEGLQAHAWVECNGQIAIGWIPEMGEFIPFPELRFER